MGPILNRATAEQRRDAALAVEELTAVLALADAKLPSLEVDWDYGRLTGAYLINLGSARTAQVLRITDLLRKGLQHERQADGA
ncbi:hypothetical protein [Streptomyces sp. CB01881]|uniref:hypothetical protein n=1 Tax=Streptomyces sp. CB01881 TaxID=2078691 RepID=UPI000CDCDBD9|nr:hypothetical protein [Streptomyces sp. CB01881]AUY47682.1 hypothetical protein C2142_00395 [Streptomyces sp. CB01881]TYC76156.1 hypothetical protein EH183_00395 [Streptomyces sp. CB01881]